MAGGPGGVRKAMDERFVLPRDRRVRIEVIGDDLNFILTECRRMAGALSLGERARLLHETGAAESGMVIFQMSRGWELGPEIPEWAGPRLRAAVEKARELRREMEVSRKLREG